MQGRLAITSLGVHIGSSLNQRGDHLGRSIPDAVRKRCVVTLIKGIDVGSSGDEQTHKLRISASRSQVKERLPKPFHCVERRALLDQEHRHLSIAFDNRRA